MNPQDLAGLPRILQGVSGSPLGLDVSPRLRFDLAESPTSKMVREAYTHGTPQTQKPEHAKRKHRYRSMATAIGGSAVQTRTQTMMLLLRRIGDAVTAMVGPDVFLVKEYTALIDSGAFFQGFDKRKLACEMLKLFRRLRASLLGGGGVPGSARDIVLTAIVFYNDDDSTGKRVSGLYVMKIDPSLAGADDPEKCLPPKGPLSGSNKDEIAKMIDPSVSSLKELAPFSWFCFYDQARTRGFDLPNPMFARAVVTATSDTAENTLLQAVKRMRGS